MQLAYRHDERPGKSYEALDGKKADSLQLGKVSFDMEDDTTCTVPVHPEVAGDTWFGRTLDLSRAYKQLALDETSRLLSLVGYFIKSGGFSSGVMCFLLAQVQQSTASIGSPYTT